MLLYRDDKPPNSRLALSPITIAFSKSDDLIYKNSIHNLPCSSFSPSPLAILPIFLPREPRFLPLLSWNLIERAPTRNIILSYHGRERNTSFHPAIQFLLPHFFSFLSFLLLLFSTAFNRGTMRTRLFLDLLSRAASPRGESHGLYRECLQGLSSHPSQWSVPVTYVPCLYRPCSDPGIPRTRGCNTYAVHLSSPSPPLSLSVFPASKKDSREFYQRAEKFSFRGIIIIIRGKSFEGILINERGDEREMERGMGGTLKEFL